MSSPKLTCGRYSAINAVYTVTTVTYNRRSIFAAPDLAQIVRQYIEHSDREGYSQTHAWVIMPDHVHWMFALSEGNVSVCLMRFKSRCARAINRAREVYGPVWQAGFYDHQLRNEEDLREQAHYIIANPVRAGIVADIRDYPHWGCRWMPHPTGW